MLNIQREGWHGSKGSLPSISAPEKAPSRGGRETFVSNPNCLSANDFMHHLQFPLNLFANKGKREFNIYLAEHLCPTFPFEQAASDHSDLLPSIKITTIIQKKNKEKKQQ